MKLKKKNCAIALIILLLLLFEIVNPFKLASSHALRELKYSKDSANKIIEYNLKDRVLEHEYSEFIDKFVSSKYFNVSNYEIYQQLNYYNHFDNLELINKLIEKGYNASEIDCIVKTGNDSSINEFLNKDKYENIVEFLNFDYAKLHNLERYIAYQKKTIYDYDETVLYVEIGLDNEFYTEYNDVNEFSFDMLVNKYNKLDDNFVPEDLVLVDKKYSVNNSNYGNSTMLNQFYKMADDLNKELDLKVYIRSGYRTYESQQEVYDEYLDLYGKNYVKKYVAYPGFSEHQTGLAVDLKASSSNTFKDTKEAKWLKENAYKYGFIERYTKKLEDVTGYQNESWHYRYVGVEIATYIKENNISFDEYYVRFLSK